MSADNFDLREFALCIFDQQNELDRLRAGNAELRHYRDDYIKLLNSNIQHNEHMLGGFMQLALKPGFGEFIEKSRADS